MGMRPARYNGHLGRTGRLQCSPQEPSAALDGLAGMAAKDYPLCRLVPY
jgi:hypothetical protein